MEDSVTMASPAQTTGDKKQLASKAGIDYTEVIVIGNGPSGITLSLFLSGNWPHYIGESHPNKYLHLRLTDDAKKSLVEQDLAYLSSGLEGRSNNPVALLFDALTHPGADFGLDSQSQLQWDHHTEQEIPHVVLGRAHAGGAWQMIEGNMQTLSLGSWMELPGIPFKAWVKEHRKKTNPYSVLRPDRASIQEVREYYAAYVREKNLLPSFRENTVVTSVERVLDVTHSIDSESGEQNPCSKDHCGCKKWEVRGYKVTQNDEGHETCQEFCYRGPNVVLATGTYDIPNRLGICGENQPHVLKSLNELEAKIKTGELNTESDPVVIIGAGLSAADAVICARHYNIHVVHVFRREAEDPNIIFNKLPAALYPEYHRVHQMMKGQAELFEGYESYPAHKVVEIRADKKVIFQGTNTHESIIQASYVVIQIGSRPDLTFLPQEGKNLGIIPDVAIDSKHNPFDVDPFTYQSLREYGLYAMGPLVGDNFVRFIRGGALAISSHLWRKKHNLL